MARSFGDRLLERVREAIARHLRLPLAVPGLVAFSGGPDSLCLLHLLSRLGFPLRALHVDHGLRPAAAAEAEAASRLAAAVGVPLEVRRARMPRQATGNLQERAREVRRALLLDGARELGCGWVALGHTAQDQAETVLMRAMRGSGLTGLGGMAWRSGLLVRPLLGVTRSEVEAYLREEGLQAVEDPTNLTDAYLRNRVRHRLLPLLVEENPRVVLALARLAASCREEGEALELAAREALDRARLAGGLSVARLRELPPGLLHRTLRLAYREATGSTRRLARRHLELVTALLDGDAGTTCLDLPGLHLERRYQVLVIDPAPSPATFEAQDIPGPGRYLLGDGRVLVLEETPPPDEKRFHLLDGGRLSFPLQVRAVRAGERIAIAPQRTKKVARVLMEARIPRHRRQAVPLLLDRGEVIAILGIRRAFDRGPRPGGFPLFVWLDSPGG